METGWLFPGKQVKTYPSAGLSISGPISPALRRDGPTLSARRCLDQESMES